MSLGHVTFVPVCAAVVLPLRAAAAGEGIDLLAVGIDPLNTAERAPLLIHAKRYQRMAEYLGRLGPCWSPDDATDRGLPDQRRFR